MNSVQVGQKTDSSPALPMACRSRNQCPAWCQVLTTAAQDPKRPANEAQGLLLVLPSNGSGGSTNCFAHFDPLPQLAAEAEGSGGAKEREGARDGWDKISLGPSVVGII